METTNHKKKSIRFLGCKISSNTLAFFLIAGICSVILIVGTTYRNDKIKYGQTEIVSAKIIDVGTRLRGGTRLSKYGYIKFVYIVNGKEFIRYIDSFKIREELYKYHIGDCIELKVSLENEDIYKWNEEKGTFKCR